MTDDQDNGTQAVPLSEAAARLGISEELVRKRIYRGKLKGHKIDGRWHVVLNGQDKEQVSLQDTTGQRQDTQGSSAALIAHQQEEIEFLRRELAARAEEMTKQREQWGDESRRKDVLLHELSTQLKSLPAAIIEVQQTQQESPDVQDQVPVTSTPGEAPSSIWQKIQAWFTA